MSGRIIEHVFGRTVLLDVVLYWLLIDSYKQFSALVDSGVGAHYQFTNSL